MNRDSRSKTAELSGKISMRRPDTEGCEESQSGAEHTGRGRPPISRHEAAAFRLPACLKRYAEHVWRHTEVRDKKPTR